MLFNLSDAKITRMPLQFDIFQIITKLSLFVCMCFVLNRVGNLFAYLAVFFVTGVCRLLSLSDGGIVRETQNLLIAGRSFEIRVADFLEI